ncbi:MAG: hypothetical protein KJO69_10035 [Gammaproteobacteria bacterium]|nr:hypothetical protein [Gammaproteobacteria bacterium]
MAVNRLIAMGGTSNPAESFARGRSDAQQREMNKLAITQAQLQNKAVKNEMLDAYGQDVATIIAPITQEQDPKKQSEMYRMALPSIRQAAQQRGIPTDNIAPQYDQERAQTLVQKYTAPEKWGQPVSVMEGDQQKMVQFSPTGKSRETGYSPIPKAGQRIEVDKDGNVIFTQGGQAQGLSKTTARKIEEKAFNAQEQMARYQAMKNAFDPKLLTAKSQLRTKLAQAKNWLDIDLSEEEKQLVKNTVRMNRRTAENLSGFIKDMSGAAVSVQEYKRLEAVMPTPDNGPLVYATKLEDVMEMTQWGMWRYNYALKKGLDPLKTNISIYEMNDVVDREGEKIELRIRQENPGIDEQTINSMVATELRGLFGE